MAESKSANTGGDPQWYKDAVIYELHIKSFADANGDGIGDFEGLLEKLDYLERLGVTAIWLLPFYPSPLRDDGYDISDYKSINPDYGDMKQFRRFVREAHKRGLRVITELVINHTSDQHPWFKRARKAKPGSTHRDFYVWSDDPDKYDGTRIIFTDTERSNWTWDPVAESYYWHRFFSHQPDLNFDNPAVQKEIYKTLDFWMKAGVDGVRLDAIPYLFEREGTNNENLPETHGFLKELRAYLDANYSDRMFLAEANQWPEEAAEYFGDGDECHVSFHFPLMPRLFMAIQMEDRFPIVDILEQTPEIPESCQWAIFLRNHDELTLEMVTDEERDYMYRVYAHDRRMRINVGIRRRLAPLLSNDRRSIELMNLLLLSLPGTPVIYYGDEIGMGDNFYLGDRDGVRTPMQWSPDRNAGFSSASPHKLFLPVISEAEYHASAVNVENQESNPYSLLWWMRRMIATRKNYKVFGRGSMKVVDTGNNSVLGFIREYEDERILVLANLSAVSQVAEIDLEDYAGVVPEEVFSGTEMPKIGEDEYIVTFGPRDFFWLQLGEAETAAGPASAESELQTVDMTWAALVRGDGDKALESALRPYVRRCRWFGGKGRKLRRLTIRDRSVITHDGVKTLLLRLGVTYADAEPETYLLPIAQASGDAAYSILNDHPEAAIATINAPGDHAIIHDAVHSQAFRDGVLAMIDGNRQPNDKRRIGGQSNREFDKLLAGSEPPVESWVLRAEQSNTSIIYDDKLFLKLYRKLEEGVNPDVEIARFLTEQTGFRNLPVFTGTLWWAQSRGEPVTVGVMQEAVPNEGDAWSYTLGAVRLYYDHVIRQTERGADVPELPEALTGTTIESLPMEVVDLVGAVYLEKAALLGRRTAEFHFAMASNEDDPIFAPEDFSKLYQRSAYQSMRSMVKKVFSQLRPAAKRLADDVRVEAENVLSMEERILGMQQKITGDVIAAQKIRVHGDYHLGQVLHTGKDFVLIDFEGEPARPLSERRLKRSPLRDVAGMIRSFHYAPYAAVVLDPSRAGQIDELAPWADLWYRAVTRVFLSAYTEALGDSPIVPHDENGFTRLLYPLLLDKAVYEVGYEMNNRPGWLRIPVRGIQMILRGNL